MAQENLNTSFPNSGLGDALRNAFTKVQNMFTDLYSNVVFKVTGKDLSTNDFTNALKAKLDGIENFADVNMQPDWLQNDVTADDYIKNKPDFAGLVPDGFTLAETSLVDQEFTINEAQWYVNGQLNILPFSFPALSFEIPLAGTGLQRLDLFYGTNVGTIERIEGDEAIVAVEPTLPPNSVRLTVILTNDTASTPPAPIDLSGYILKTALAYLPLSSQAFAIEPPLSMNFVTTDGDGVSSFSGWENVGANLFIGKRMIIRNDKTTDFPLNVNGLKDATFAQAYIVKAGDNIEFDFTASGFRQVGSSGVTIHNNLTNRDAVNAHPISSITGLETALDAKQNNSIYITSAPITVNNGRYIANGTFTVPDITSPVAGSNYEVVVRGGSVTINSVAYQQGNIIQRIHDGTSWATIVLNQFNVLTVTTSVDIATSVEWNNKIITIDNGSNNINITTNNQLTLAGNKNGGSGIVSFKNGSVTNVLVNGISTLTGTYDTFSIIPRSGFSTNLLYISRQ